MQKDYLSYTEVDFIADAYFQQWAKNPDEENTAFWYQVLAAFPQKAGTIMAARSFLENMQIQADYPTKEQTEASLENSLRTIAASQYAEPVKRSGYRARRHYLFAVTATVLLGVVAVFCNFQQDSVPVTIEIVAGAQEIKTVVLPDQSIVTLNAGAHLTYSSDMKHASRREVWLDGEGFFHVKHRHHGTTPSRFTVHCGDMDIEVLGTTFNVKKIGTFTNVSLNSGKIKIGFKNDPQTAIYLQPGDFVRYSSQQKHITKKQVKPELYSVWKEKKIVLDHMSLAEIARLLEDSYGYTTYIENRTLAQAEISGTLVMKDEATVLKTLASSLDIDIMIKDSVLNFQLKRKN
jgi:ferric-dicitrate binding protein FerR (iron transport regulator)